MADAPASPPPRPKLGLLTIATFVLVFWIMINAELRTQIGVYAGLVLDPLLGFGGRFPVLTIMLAGAFVVVTTTLLRHFTTDWLEMAKATAYTRHFQRELMQARKDNNTYKIKVLTEKQPEVMAGSQRMQTAQMKQMPITMLISMPVFFWVLHYLSRLQYTSFAEPWNPTVEMFGFTGIFPHWVLLQIALSIPLGFLVQRIMKYIAWRERWKPKHPEVTE